jgi:predicted RNase H-like HicB family nuclease
VNGEMSSRCEKPVTTPRHRYAVIVYWSNEDDAFIAEAPELPRSAADGKTYQEAITNLEVIMDEWIETATELGWTIPEPKARRLALAGSVGTT